MTTTRKLTLIVSAAVLVGLLAASAGFVLSRSGGSKGSSSASSASGSRISAMSSGAEAESLERSEETVEDASIVAATAEEPTSDSSSTPTADAPANAAETTIPAVEDAGAAADAAPSSSSSGGLANDPRLRLDGIPRLTTDLVGPLVSSTKCAALNYFETYVTDDSAIESVKVRYLDGPVTRRTTTLTKLDHHGDGNYYVGFLIHNSPTPLSEFVVTAVDVRGNTTVKSVRVSCP